MNNIETLCLIHFYVKGFLSSVLTMYYLEGDKGVISKINEIFEEGKSILDEVLPKVEKISRELNVEVNEEVVPYNAPTMEKETELVELHVGTPANELSNSYGIQFISDIFRRKLGLVASNMFFFVYCLPPLPAIVTDEGVKETFSGGFYSIRNKRIEINVVPCQSLPKIYESIVHEMIHHAILIDPTINHNEIIVGSFVDEYFEASKSEFTGKRTKILQSMEEIVEDKKSLLENFDSALNCIGKNVDFIQRCTELQKSISQGKVRAVRINGTKLENMVIQDAKWHVK